MFAASKTDSASDGGYQISRSLRFNSADSAYLNRTPASATNRRTWTLSTWAKVSAFGSQVFILGAGVDGDNRTDIRFDGDSLQFVNNVANVTTANLKTTAVYRDPSAWYHIVIAVDSTQATSTNRIKIYVNGVQVTDFATATYFSQNTDTFVNNNCGQTIGRYSITSSNYFNGYMTEFNLIDGTQLTPSSFGETNAQTGVWTPKAYSGSYGTNGFYLNFSDNSNTTAATLGKDYSGNGNNWTPNGFSVSSGAGNDSLVDSPTSYGTDTGVGGTVRGNYCTLNPLNNSGTLTNGNLDFVHNSSSTSKSIFATLGVSSGKWYWEMTVTVAANSYYPGLGIETNTSASPDSQSGDTASGYIYLASGQKYNNGTLVSVGPTFTNGDVIGVALDMDAGTITVYKNNTSQGQLYSGITGTARPVTVGSGSTSGTFNFGQRPFAYTAPSGFKALCTQNLPTPTIGATSATQANKYFDTSLYTGTGSTLAVTNSGGFQPDWVWIKCRSVAYNHALFDVLRGVNKVLISSTTDPEATETAGSLSAFNSNGFTLASGTASYAATNVSGQTFVGWQWKANGSGSTNTAGSITSTVSANTTSGFSVVTYTGTAVNATVGHGLGVAPTIIFIKNRTASGNWVVYNLNATTNVPSARPMYLNTGNGEIANGDIFNYPSTNTTTVFNIGTNAYVNASTNNYVAYCFTPIAGYSAMNIFTGNGSADGPFVYCGFRPAYVLIKDTTNNGDWFIWDTARDTYNVSQYTLLADTAGAETSGSANYIDILSNGFKIKATTAGFNTNTDKFLFMAFASAPFKFSLAR
jgi:hypothetical protein